MTTRSRSARAASVSSPVSSTVTSAPRVARAATSSIRVASTSTCGAHAGSCLTSSRSRSRPARSAATRAPDSAARGSKESLARSCAASASESRVASTTLTPRPPLASRPQTSWESRSRPMPSTRPSSQSLQQLPVAVVDGLPQGHRERDVRRVEVGLARAQGGGVEQVELALAGVPPAAEVEQVVRAASSGEGLPEPPGRGRRHGERGRAGRSAVRAARGACSLQRTPVVGGGWVRLPSCVARPDCLVGLLPAAVLAHLLEDAVDERREVLVLLRDGEAVGLLSRPWCPRRSWRSGPAPSAPPGWRRRRRWRRPGPAARAPCSRSSGRRRPA